MKRILALLLVATLAGCVGGEDIVSKSGTESLMPGAYKIFTYENPVWAVQNGSATVLLLDENQDRIGSLFLDNTTSVSIGVPLSRDQTVITAIVEGGEVFVSNVQGAVSAPVQFASIPLVIQETTIPQTPDFILPPLGLDESPVSLTMNVTLPFAPTMIRPMVSGTFTNLELRITTERGLIFDGQETRDGGLGPGNVRQYPLDGQFFPAAISGTVMDIEISADNFDGALILEAIGYSVGQDASTIGNQLSREKDADISFKFGQLQAPSRVDLHEDSKFLFLESNGPAAVLVYGAEGQAGRQEFNGTLQIPVSEPFYGLVPIFGEVSVGTDVVPIDFEMRALATETTRFSNDLQANGRYETAQRNITVPGIPYAVYPDREFGEPLLTCYEEGYLAISGDSPRGAVTYAFSSSGFGWADYGVSLWAGNNATLSIGQPRSACDTLYLDVYTFTF